MPILKSKYQTPNLFKSYHVSTMYAALFRKVKSLKQCRERLELEDGDFIDIDWSYANPNKTSNRALIILHGLEGNAQRPYIMGLAGHFNNHNWDVAAINFRGCSGEINRLYRSYNAGATEDLEAVLSHIVTKKPYSTLAVNGFSLGGNLLLKYLGEQRELPKQLKAGVAISAPCDLYGSLRELERPKNRLYSQRFIKKLRTQLYLREQHFPGEIDKRKIAECKTLFGIDDLYTSKAHGYEDARDYYNKSSSLNFIPNIKTPTLLINAQNDAFLSPSSTPVEIAESHSSFFLEHPKYGGHVGFLQKQSFTYSEQRALEFIESQL